jgi:hypothetical protein
LLVDNVDAEWAVSRHSFPQYLKQLCLYESVGPIRYAIDTFKNPYATITNTQQQLVTDRGAALDRRGWTVDYRHNLFAAPNTDTVRDFEKSGELTADGGGRIAAPHSSTALTINMLDHWRDRDLTSLGEAMQLNLGHIVAYEQPHDLGFQRPAQPDIEFTDATGNPIAVEVKLREPYGSVKNEVTDRYFETPGLWDGLPALLELAISIRNSDATFTTLHAAQLIKHTLGLTRSYGTEFVLGYLWHDIPTETGNKHVQELAEFANIASTDINFKSVTVTELLRRLNPDQDHKAWHDYMTARYVTPTGL